MTTDGQPPRPSPTMMPKRRPTIAPAPAARARAHFAVATHIPRRGWPDATVWPDTGILLMLGSDPDLPRRFRSHYSGRTRVCEGVDRETRGHANIPAEQRTDDATHDRWAAAVAAVDALLVTGRSLPIMRLDRSDLPAVAAVTRQLKGLSDENGKAHGGEAQIIVLAARAMAESNGRHVLLSNDGGASVVATRFNIPSRHAGDVLGEMACADRALTAKQWMDTFTKSLTITSPPARCRPKDNRSFQCRAGDDGCADCDRVERSA